MIKLRVTYILFSLFWSQQLCFSHITIEIPRDAPFVWEGCVFRRVDIVHGEGKETNCSLCTLNGKNEAVFKKEPKEKYRNCTAECLKPTICTIYLYKLGDVLRPECYQCEAWQDENIYFKFIRGFEICSEGCQKCARTVDLATASLCAFICGGKPTFCYPPKLWFGNEVCYQSNYTYGCRFDTRTRLTFAAVHFGEENLGNCLKCVRPATKADRHFCSLDCNGRASYLADKSEGKYIYQCTLDSYQDIFDHDIPEIVRMHIRSDFHPMAAKNLTLHPPF